MPTDEPLAALYRRLGAQPRAGAEGADPDPEEIDADLDAAVPAWIPDGRAGRPRAWLGEIRADPARAGGIALAIVAALAVLITVFTLIRQHPEPVASAKLPPVETVSTSAVSGPAASGPAASGPAVSGSAVATPTTQGGQSVVVSVVGLVAQPGLVTLKPDARVSDAVAAAGGALHGADTLGLNLARHVADGEQIVVGIATPAGHPAALGSSIGGGIPRSGAPAAPAKPVGPVDLNTGSAEDFDALPGVGPVTAAAIVAWRTTNGRFTSVDQLGEVDGIGPARLEKLRTLVRI